MEKLINIKSKIYNKTDLLSKLNIWRFQEKTIVFTNGCFDILHKGHIEYLAKAADLGNKLIIGLNTDNSVKKLKGENRPVKDENTRALILASLSFVDIVVLFNEDTPYNLIKYIKPNILTKGGDYEIKQIVGYDIVTQIGGRVITIDFVKGQSSTKLINKMS